jgi:type II secretory pathway pseudopilin PulG
MLALSKALQSSKAAIDLASIMVGVIIIGLIGGVIAATVFAVIPWSQDKAAKQQLESVHTAENAFFGLSSDPSTDLTNGKKNSFATSTELASAGLLAENSAVYCVASAGTNNYTAYVKSASGKIFKATNANKTPVVDTTGTDCFSATPVPTTPPVTGPVYTPVASYDFESNKPTTSNYGSSTVTYSTAKARSGATSIESKLTNVNTKNWGATVTFSEITNGNTYRVSAWVYTDSAVVSDFTTFYSISGGPTPVKMTATPGSWQQVTTEFKAGTSPRMTVALYVSTYDKVGSTVYIDDVTIEQVS